MATLKKRDDGIILHLPIHSHFGAIWKLDSGRMACKTYIFNKSNLLFYQKMKTELKSL